MKKKKKQVLILVYLVLFVTLAFTNIQSIGFVICALTVLGLITNILSIEFAFMTSLVMNSELTSIILILACIIYLMTKHRPKIGHMNFKIYLCAIMILTSSLVNMIINEAYYNTLFGIIYYIAVILIAAVIKGAFDEEKLIGSIKSLLFIEFVSGIAIILSTRSLHPGDLHKGTFSNAHHFTFWLICVLLYMFIYYRERGLSISKNLRKNWTCFFIGIILIVMSDGKNVLLGFLVATLVYGFSYLFSKKTKNRVILSIIILYTSLFVILLFLHLPIVESFIRRNFINFSIYLYDSRYAFKTKYFEGTIFEELSGIRSLFGYGIGQYGSRFANLFGYKYMYRENNFINNFVSSHFDSVILPNYAKYASVYTQSLVDTIKWRSAVLTYPFSSVIAFLAENGLIGLLFITYIWGKWANKSIYGILVLFLFSSCIFDIYFDHISLLALILVLVSSGVRNNKSGVMNNKRILDITMDKRIKEN